MGAECLEGMKIDSIQPFQPFLPWDEEVFLTLCWCLSLLSKQTHPQQITFWSVSRRNASPVVLYTLYILVQWLADTAVEETWITGQQSFICGIQRSENYCPDNMREGEKNVFFFTFLFLNIFWCWAGSIQLVNQWFFTGNSLFCCVWKSRSMRLNQNRKVAGQKAKTMKDAEDAKQSWREPQSSLWSFSVGSLLRTISQFCPLLSKSINWCSFEEIFSDYSILQNI